MPSGRAAAPLLFYFRRAAQPGHLALRLGWLRPFGVPVNVPQLSFEALELSARLSPDERTVFVVSNRVGGAGGVDLYTGMRGRTLGRVRRADSTSRPVDGLWIYFASSRGGGGAEGELDI